MSTAVRVQACAKINVRLKVLSVETSGFHSLETVFVRIALADTVIVRVANTGRTLRVNGASGFAAASGPKERNLALRAANAYAETTGWPSGFEIELEKRIPVGAGLGGGSADAAAVLRALNLLAPRPRAERDLLRIAGSLGADVPFLVTDNVAALAWGRGDRMLALAPLETREVVLLKSEIGVSTLEAYAWLDSTRAGHPAVPVLIPFEALSSWDGLAQYAENDFEPPVIAQQPDIARMIAALDGAGAQIARMSGSGSTVFGIFPPAAQPPVLPVRAGWKQLLTRTLDSVVRPEPLE